MGGLIIILATVVPTLLWARLDSRYVVVAVLAMLWTGAIGFIDDYLKIVRGKSQGLVARWKLVGQVTFGVALGIALILWPLAPDLPPSSTQLPVFKYMLLVLPAPLYLLFVTVVVTGSSNAVNLTDGLDGLAAGLTAILAGTFAAFAYVFGRIDWTRYLGVYFLPGSQELTIFCGALAGAALGFLWFNAHPAQVFMGDTGSLAIGGALCAVAIMLKAEFLVLIAGGVFAAEEWGGRHPPAGARRGAGVRERRIGPPLRKRRARGIADTPRRGAGRRASRPGADPRRRGRDRFPRCAAGGAAARGGARGPRADLVGNRPRLPGAVGIGHALHRDHRDERQDDHHRAGGASPARGGGPRGGGGEHRSPAGGHRPGKRALPVARGGGLVLPAARQPPLHAGDRHPHEPRPRPPRPLPERGGVLRDR